MKNKTICEYIDFRSRKIIEKSEKQWLTSIMAPWFSHKKSIEPMMSGLINEHAVSKPIYEWSNFCNPYGAF